MSIRVFATIAVVLVASLVGVGCGGGGAPGVEVLGGDAQHYDYDYLIPPGTGVRIDKGEDIEVVPAELDVKVGESIRIVNKDSRGASVGIFWVPAGSTVAMQFTSPGRLTGECDIHPSGKFTVDVGPA